MGCFLQSLLSPPVFLEFLVCGWGSSPLLPRHVCLRYVATFSPGLSARPFSPSQATQLSHSSATSPLTSPLLLHPSPGNSDPLQYSVMDLVLLLSLCCSRELALGAGCALPFAGAVAMFCKMVQPGSVCVLPLILSFVSLVLQGRLLLQRLT